MSDYTPETLWEMAAWCDEHEEPELSPGPRIRAHVAAWREDNRIHEQNYIRATDEYAAALAASQEQVRELEAREWVVLAAIERDGKLSPSEPPGEEARDDELTPREVLERWKDRRDEWPAMRELWDALAALQDQVRELEARAAAVRAMAHAEEFADKGHYYMAADQMWREPFVKTSELADLAHALAMGTPSRGDWDGFRVYFWKAWLAASEPPVDLPHEHMVWTEGCARCG